MWLYVSNQYLASAYSVVSALIFRIFKILCTVLFYHYDINIFLIGSDWESLRYGGPELLEASVVLKSKMLIILRITYIAGTERWRT